MACKRTKKITRPNWMLISEFEHLVSFGNTRSEAARRLGVTLDAVTLAYRRRQLYLGRTSNQRNVLRPATELMRKR